MTNKDNTMEERFDEFAEHCFMGFGDDGEEDFNIYLSSLDTDELKAFIASEKERSRREGIEEVVGKLYKLYFEVEGDDSRAAVDEIIKSFITPSQQSEEEN